MAENDSTASGATPKEPVAITVVGDDAELSNVQASLDRMMSSGDDKTKRLIFNRVICQMADALPDLPPEAHSKEAKPVPASTRNLIAAADKLREAAYLAEFIQSISLNGRSGDGILLQPGQLTGFYYAMEDTIDRIKEAEVLIDTARKQPEALLA